MTSKEALKDISELHFCGQDLCTKEWYESGVISDTYEDEVKCINKDLDVLNILRRYCTNDGWSNGYSIAFYKMKDKELKQIQDWFETSKEN